MPSINLTTRFSGKVDEVINNGALSTPSINKDYSFVGAQTVKVYSFNPVALNDYSRSGTSRYGTPEELGDSVQEMTMSQDKAFTFTIDKGNATDTEPGVREAGKQLRRETDLAIIPELDKYRFTKIANAAGHKFYATTALTASTAYAAFLAANEAIDEADVPSTGRICNASPKFLTLIKQDSNFIKSGDLSQRTLFNGQVGEIDGVAIIKVPSSRLPAGLLFEITHPMATTAPVKINEYKLHTDPPGISGMLAEGRVYHDAFVLNNKARMISAYYGGGENALTLSAAAGSSSTKSKVTVTGNTAGGTLVYKGDYASAATAGGAVDIGDDVTGFTAFPSDGQCTTASGKYIAVAVKDGDGKCVASGVIAAVVGS
jgi:N4-gp56 family major capsid protein